MTTMSRKPVSKRAISGIILIVLGLQGIATFGAIEHLGWPFVNYPMYSWPHHWGETINRYTLFGTLENGTEVPITADDLNLNFWEYLWGPVAAVRKHRIADVGRYLAHDRHLNSRLIVGVRLENRPVLFTIHGAEGLPPKTVNVIRMDETTSR